MRILVTGGSGFIGSHLLEELFLAGHTVFSLDVREPQNKLPNVEYILLDFCSYPEIEKTFLKVKPDAICHLGALPSIPQSIKEPVVSMKSNVTGTYSVLEAARQAKVRRFILASSAAVYGKTALEYSGKAISESVNLQPMNGYALAKKIGEEMVRLWSAKDIWDGIDGVSLRFFNVFGPRQRKDSPYKTCIENFLLQWKNKEPFTIVGDGNQRRDMVFVKDIVRAIRLAAETENKLQGESVNIGTGKNYSVLEIADMIGGKDYPRTFLPARYGEIRESLADISKAKELFGWEPKVSFAEGIEILKKS